MTAKTPSNKKQILVIDDDPVVAMIIEERLGNEGYIINRAIDGQSGLQLAETSCPDLILLDVKMPIMDGFQVCQAIRQSHWGKHIPVMMLTGLDDVDSVEQAFIVGATDFFTKPINWSLLFHRIAFLLRAADNLLALRISEERYALAARGANDGLWDWDIRNDHFFFSPRWIQMVHLDPALIVPSLETWLKLIPKSDRERVRHTIKSHLNGHSTHFKCEYRIQCGDGQLRWMLSRGIAIFNEANEATRMSGSQTDITDQKMAEFQLSHDALHDSLTGLPNRTLFMDRLQHALERTHRDTKYGFSLLFFDLDRFKHVNDSLGHLQGDLLLQEVAERLKAEMRSNDTLARLGGDEFTMLCENCDTPAAVKQSVGRVLERLAHPIELKGESVTISASIGIAFSGDGYQRAEEILRDADTAMYMAKAKGRGRYAIFDKHMRLKLVDQLQLESDMEGAVEREEFQLYYQPIMDATHDWRLLGFEALLRWQHPARGILLPEQFLGIAEESGQIKSIGPWTITTAIEQLAKWRKLGIAEVESWYISINLSATQINDPNIPELVASTLETNGLTGKNLNIEVTESVLLDDDIITTANLRQLSEMGSKLCIDDFGTGYSSFSYLHHYPFDIVKIDRNFVRSLSRNQGRRTILRAMVAMAHNLGMSVIAEGVEEQDDASHLPEMKCDAAQGFYFSKPFDATHLEQFLLRIKGNESNHLLTKETTHE